MTSVTAARLTGVLAELTRQVSAERLMGHIAELACWTKHAGTEGELDSLAYVERELASYGYRTRMLRHDAYISLPVRGSVRFGEEVLDGITHSFSRPSRPEGVSGRLLYVGLGRPADFDGHDVRGAVVLVDGTAGPATTVEAGRRGAVGQVHVSPHEIPHEMCLSPVWGSPGDDQLDQLPRTVVVTLPRSAGTRLKEAVSRGETRVSLHAEVDTGWRRTPVLLADLESAGAGVSGAEGEPFVFLTGHHDTWYVGAMDNGAANATMLEVARLCAARREAWRRGLRLAFWSGHSQGRYSSSAWYADHHWEDLEARALVHLNVDSTGGKGNTVVSDTTAAAELGRLAEEALRLHADQPWNGRRMHRAGDQSFWGIGVPAMFALMGEQPAADGVDGEESAQAAVFGRGRRAGAGTGWWWHTPDDTADKIDPDLLVRDTRIYLHATWRLLADPVPPVRLADSARALRETLRSYQEQAAERLDLRLPVRRAEALVEGASAFQTRVDALDGDDVDGARWASETIRAVSRILVPLDYTLGDRFVHDPALFLDPLPVLADIPRLAKLPPDSDEGRFLVSRLVRARNQVAHGLREAVAVLDAALAQPNHRAN